MPRHPAAAGLRRAARLLALQVGVALFFSANPGVQAHDALPAGEGVLQLRHRQILLMVSVPAGVLSAYDTNRDGTLSAEEVSSQKAGLSAHFLQSFALNGDGIPVRWESVTPAPLSHPGHTHPSQQGIQVVVKGQFADPPKSLEFTQRLWGRDYLRNRITVVRVDEHRALQRQTRVVTQEQPSINIDLTEPLPGGRTGERNG